MIMTNIKRMIKRMISLIALQLIKYPELLEWITIGLLAGIWIERLVDYFYILSKWPQSVIYVAFLFFTLLSLILSLKLKEDLRGKRDCIYRNKTGILEEYERLFGVEYQGNVTNAHFELYKYIRLYGGFQNVYNFCPFCYFCTGINIVILFILFLISLINYSFLKAFTGG